MNYAIELSVFVRGGMETAAFDLAFDAIADALYDCDGVEDADLAGDSSSSVLTFTMNVLNVTNPEQAIATAFGVVRTALHVSGGTTEGWEDQFEFIRQSIEAESNSLVGA